MNNKYDISVRSYPISPHIAGIYRFGAGAKVYGKANGDEMKVVHTTGEVWGETKAEAEKKVIEVAKKWIAEQK